MKEHAQCLECRMNLCTESDLDKLLEEGRTIQQFLLSSPQNPKSEQQFACSIAKLRAALRLISRQEGGPPLALDEAVVLMEELRQFATGPKIGG